MSAVFSEPRLALVVDDDPDVAMVCALHLEGAGYQVAEAYSGQDAVDLAFASPPSVVVLDWMLPDIDGLTVLSKLRGDERTADIPVVMVTARSHERDQIAAWDAGVTDYLVKPFGSERLISAVNDAVERGPRSGSAREEALERLRGGERDRHAQLAAIFENAQDAVIGKTLDGEIMYWNEGARQLYGWEAQEVIGSNVAILTVPETEDEIPWILDCVSRGEKIDTFETVRLHRDGHRLNVSLSISPLRDAEGTIVGASAIARDVTARVRLESRFRGLVESAPDAIVIVDADGRIDLVNQQTEVLFGHPRETLLGRPIEALVPQRFRERHPAFRRAYADRPRKREMGAGLELYGLRADGTEFPVEISLSPLDGDSGSTYAATIRDVTERRAGEVRFQQLLEAAPDAFVGVDVDGRIVLVNEQTEHLFDTPRDAMLGRQVDVLVPGLLEALTPAQHEGIFWNAEETAHGSIDLTARRLDGQEFPAEITLSAFDVGGERLLAASIRDVTARKQAEDRFRGLVEAAPDALVIVSDDGLIQIVNAQALHLFGYERDELIDQPVEILVPKRFRDQHPQNRRAYGASSRVRPMGAGLQLAGLRKDGTEFPVEISLSPLETAQGRTVSASIRDVTARKQAEEAQALAYDREREATNRLREVDRLRSDFLSTVSHELRTPLTAIKGFAEWLDLNWDTASSERKRQLMTRILNAGGRLDFLIQDLLDFSRLERGQLKVDLRELPLSSLVAETLGHVGPAVEGHQVDVEVDDAVVVVADRVALIRVLENLLTNAVKFSPAGTRVQVTATTTADQPDVVVLSVRDEGVGIPEEEQGKVFDRFYRVAGTSDRPGTGIGLAIVKQFTEAQGGSVELCSTPGQGSEFRLRLPCVPGT